MRIKAGRVGIGLGAAVLLLVGFHIPSSTAAEGDSPWLGVYSQGLTSDLRDALEYDGEGVLVNGVVPDSPADQAGVRKGDVIVQVGRRSVDNPEDLIQAIRSSRIGSRVAIHLVREGKRETVYARLAPRSEESQQRESPKEPEFEAPVPPPAPAPEPMVRGIEPEVEPPVEKGGDLTIEIPENGLSMMGVGRGRLGVRIQNLDSELGDYFGLDDGKGVLVVEVLKDSPAARAGLKSGDVITEIDDHSVEDADDLVQTLRSQEGRINLTVVRRGSRRTFEVELRDTPRALRLRRGGNFFRAPRGHVDSPDREALERELKDLREELKELRKEMEDLKR